MNYVSPRYILLMCLLALHCNSYDSCEKIHQKPLIYRIIDAIARLNIIHKCSRSSFYRDTYKNQPPANDMYQQLAKQAYADLHIDLVHQLPIKQLPVQAQKELPHKDNQIILGLARRNSLYVNQHVLDKRKYGYKRGTTYHECIHAKYADDFMDQVVRLSSGTIVACITYKIVSCLTTTVFDALIKPSMNTTQDEHKTLRSLSSQTAGFLIGQLAGFYTLKYVSKTYNNYHERRADIESLYALQCSRCIEEMCGIRVNINNLRYKKPCNLYALGILHLSPIEKLHIAYDLKMQNKLCEHHKLKTVYKLTFWSLLKLIIFGISPLQ
ncbi:hypothetical protein KG892_03585 [Vermiphilus pyriformis]|nr:MAG: hypothetical protein KG892_03585 [Vermiphilus pyriformis]